MKRKNINLDLQIRVRQYLKYVEESEEIQNLDQETHLLNKLSQALK